MISKKQIESVVLVFATNNVHKLNEIQALLGNNFQLKTLQDIGCIEEVPETKATIEGNASQKSNYISDNYKVNCFADDTGLEVKALNGEPGVKSARYAGEAKDNEKNIDLVLEKLAKGSNRSACFKTVISLVMDKKEVLFEGIINGQLINERRGTNGFGYDAIFIPDGASKTFAEMSASEKNEISHRALAFKKLIQHLAGGSY